MNEQVNIAIQERISGSDRQETTIALDTPAKQRRVLLLTGGYPPEKGGSYNFFYKTIEHLSHRFTVLTSHFPGDTKYDPKCPYIIKRSLFLTLPLIRDERIDRLYPNLGRAKKAFLKIFERSRPIRALVSALAILRCLIEISIGKYDLIFCGHSCLPLGLVGPLAKKLFHIEYVTFVYGEEISEILHRGHPMALKLLKYVCNKAGTVVVISESTGQSLNAIGIGNRKLTLARPGVDVDKFKPISDGNRFLQTLAPNGEKLLLSVGRIIERKGFDVVIESLPEIIKRVGAVKYVIAGSGPDRKRLETKTRNLGLESSVIFLEGITDEGLPMLYNACDIFVMPNRKGRIAGDTEGFGIVFLEASACGKPVLAGRSGGAVEAVVDGVTGFVVDPESSIELTDKITYLLTYPETSKRMGMNGINRCRQHFTWQHTSEILNQVIAQSNR